jgi:hypothetical protein
MSLPWLVSVACVVAVGQTASPPATGIPEKIEKFLARCEDARRGAILQLEHERRGLRNHAGAPDAHQRIAELEERLRELVANKQPFVPPLAFPPQIGAIGRLPRLACHVDQVVSDDELLVRATFPVVVTSVRRFQGRAETSEQPVRFLIRGLPTRGVAEGSDIEMMQVFEVIGRETYRTRDRRTTRLLVLKEFDLRAVEPYFRAKAQPNR